MFGTQWPTLRFKAAQDSWESRKKTNKIRSRFIIRSYRIKVCAFLFDTFYCHCEARACFILTANASQQT